MSKLEFSSLVLVALMALSCATKESPQPKGEAATAPTEQAVVTPVIVTEPVGEDSDDPAIWLHPEDPSQSLILGTDKAGAVFVFDLAGKIIQEKTVTGLARMNNVDVGYGMILGGSEIDIAIATDRDANLVRAYRLPDMTPIDNGGIPVFETEPPERQRPMGIALYKRPSDGVFFAILSRKEGPDGSYLWQYRLDDDGTGAIEMTKVREFGAFSGSGEIEALAAARSKPWPSTASGDSSTTRTKARASTSTTPIQTPRTLTKS
jgi:3-phytase